ncbi:10266_t:CDS:2 [Racocetra fulgida]|uniref:10266_t:CDS:1 n=1 Tax=Racocetra fulgida TaxID=60492 RepID=A0A9N9F7R5_9GLOM|nr:10266_t:CDS:2 [Racocetra fulgida]
MSSLSETSKTTKEQQRELALKRHCEISSNVDPEELQQLLASEVPTILIEPIIITTNIELANNQTTPS